MMQDNILYVQRQLANTHYYRVHIEARIGELAEKYCGEGENDK